MDAQTKYEYWLDIAQYDLDVAESMLKSRHWLYVVFMCQQSIEKHVKGLYEYYLPDAPPRLHNIKAIATRVEPYLKQTFPIDKMDFFDDLTAYYLSNRYPDYISKLSSQISKAEATDVIKKTREAFTWLLTLKP